ncbi:2-acylglycerol O-acyltransferase 2-A-like [Daphnia carinata]|uniref:2-acylglycerol O-acyltransferase 2-A-like n=1 Tax=Daphnia carinata TaxID=120202 RepID=UPI00257E5980|nr:2-acylglycerol O-acyltransferase 2-A-like [Daphnia carinata]
MKIFGIEYAPLLVPLERRRQTWAVFVWIGSFFFMGPAALLGFLYLFFFTRFYFVPLFYVAWYVADIKTPECGGRRWNWVRRWSLWKDYASYFPVTLVKEADLDPKFNYFIGSHPHGILCSGAFCNFATEGTNVSKVYPGITFSLTTLNCQFVMPFYREFFMTSGAVSASRRSIDHILGSSPGGNAVILVVGGAPESLDTHPNVDDVTLILKPRKGFIRLALKHGAHLVPSFSFGENEVYDQVDNPRGSKLRSFQDYLQKMIGLAPVLIKGRGIFQYSFGIIPYRRPITTVVGKPIFVERTGNPSDEQVNELHSKYIDELVALFERHKHKYYPPREHIKLKIL